MNDIELLPPYKPLFQKPKYRYHILTGGRGSAKSFHVAYFLTWLMHEPDHVILYTRYTLVSAHLSIIPEFIEKIELLGKEDEFRVTKTEIEYKPTGSRIVFRGIKTSQGIQTARLKSIQGLTTWVLDEAEELVDKDIFDAIDLSIRQKGMDNRVIIVINPSYKEHFIYKDFIQTKRDDTIHIHTTYEDNKQNLSDSFINQAERTRKTNIHRFEHLYMGT
jgi:phage terminase large subunit